jgi:membrane protein
MKLGGIDLLDVAKRLVRKFRDDDLMDEAAAVAFHMLFAVVPLMIFMTALSGFVSRYLGTDDVVDDVTNWLFDHLPDTTAAAVEQPIQDVLSKQQQGLLSIGAVLALWGAKNAISALMKGLNVSFGVDDARPWLKKNAVAIGLTLALGLSIVLSSILLVVGTAVGEQIFDALGVGDSWATVWLWLRWPIVLVILLLGLACLYWAGPNVDAPFRWLTPGAVLAVVLWMVATLGLGVYFKYAGSYATTYGVLGGVLAFVFWMFLTSFVILLGGELNAVLMEMSPSVRADVEVDTAGEQPERPSPHERLVHG